MKQMLLRPSAALFPAVLLISALRGDSRLTALVFLWWMAMQICTLCSAEAFRNAAAREPGVRRVDKRFSGTWPVLVLGGLLGAAAGHFLQQKGMISDWMLPAAAAWLIIIEQLFEERMFALSRRTDGVVQGVIANVLLLAGLMLDSSGGVSAPVEMPGFYTACGAGLGAVISIAAGYGVEGMHAFSLKPVNIGFFPKAAVQSLLYPALALGLCALVEAESGGVNWPTEIQALLAGMLLWRIGRTVCRRAEDESRPLNLLIMAVCAALVIASLWFAPGADYVGYMAVAMVCTLAVFCAPGWRIYAGAALILAAWLISLMRPEYFYAVIAACAIAVALNLHKAFLRKV